MLLICKVFSVCWHKMISVRMVWREDSPENKILAWAEKREQMTITPHNEAQYRCIQVTCDNLLRN